MMISQVLNIGEEGHIIMSFFIGRLKGNWEAIIEQCEGYQMALNSEEEIIYGKGKSIRYLSSNRC